MTMTPRTVPLLLALALAVTLGACAKPAYYQPMKNEVGYGQQKLENDRYRVWFSGNSLTPRETVENYVLYRAAELTLADGFDYFVLARSDTDGDRQRSSGGTVSFGFGGFGWGSHGGYGIGVSTPPADRDPRYYGQLDVTLRKGKKPANDANAYDARALKDNLEPSIVRPPAD